MMTLIMFVLICAGTYAFVNVIGGIAYVLAHVAIIAAKLIFMLVAFLCACFWFIYDDIRKEHI